MSSLPRCNCDGIPISLEVRTPGKNRGRWYLKCPTGSCHFFKWDESPHPFIQHPYHVYEAIKPRRLRPSHFNFRPNQENESVLGKTKVHVVFSVLEPSLIGIRASSNLTLDNIISNAENVQWSEKYKQYTIPANVPMYNSALAALPRDLPNFHLEIDPIPPAVLDAIIETTLLASNHADSNYLSQVEIKYTQFVESNIWHTLNDIQREAVKTGIERKGRILMANENGIGSIQQALALVKMYQDEWPVIVSCPAILCQTWQQEIINCLSLDPDEILIVDPKVPKKNMFSADMLSKRKRKMIVKKVKPVAPRKSYKKRMQEQLDGTYDSSSSSESEEEQQEPEEEFLSHVKFFIASHELTAKRRKEIAAKQFKMMICADSHYLKSWTKGESKYIVKLLQDHPKAILISDGVVQTIPVNMFTQLQALAPTMFNKFDDYVKRYCDAKSTVFGTDYKGRSNQEEFRYLLNNYVWYSPRLEQLKSSFPDIVRQKVLIKARDVALRRLVERIKLMDQTDEQDRLIQEAHVMTAEIKREGITEYLAYVKETYRRPKIALIYHNQVMIKHVEKHLNAKMTYVDKVEDAIVKCEEYNKSHTVQFVVLDTNMEELDICLKSVDLVIFLEIPLEREITNRVESYFKHKERKGPLKIVYLIAPDTIDEYLYN